jgi:Rod binding domain-containing protein
MATILPVQSAPTAAQLADPRIARLWKAAQDFEGMTIGELLKPMFDTVDTSKGLFGGGPAEQTWRPMLVSEIGKEMERHGGLGLAVPVFNQMLRAQEQAAGGSAHGRRIAMEKMP